MKQFFLTFLLLASNLFCAEDIAGFWKTVNEDGEAQCIIAIYPYKSMYYGRIVATFNPEGKIDDSIYHPVKRAPGIVGDPYYSGLDIIYDLKDDGNRFKGKIVDPEKGNVYKAELWIDDGNLIVRGKLLIFGRSQTWYPVTKFPADFKEPDTNKFVPEIPETK